MLKFLITLYSLQIFDKDIKSYIYNLEGGPSTKMQLPRDERQQLSLSQPFLVLQLSVPLGVSFSVQLMYIVLTIINVCLILRR